MELYEPTGKQYVHIAKISKHEIDKIGIEIANQPRETLQSFYNRQTKKPDLVTNLGLFGMNSQGLPCFSLVSNYKEYAYDGLRTEGFGITDGNELLYGEHKERDWKDFCSSYPMLIKDSKKTTITYATELSYKTRRTCVGYNKDNIYVICVDAPGMTFNELQDLGMSLGLQYMLNADGGGSTRMMHNGETVTNGLENRAVDNFLVVYLKEEASKEPSFTTYNKGGQTLKIYEDIVQQKGGKVRPGIKRDKKWVVVHETGNTKKGANAKNHATYLKNLAAANTTYVSWHYTVDDECAYHHIPDDEVTWHASDGSKEGGGNYAGIGVEICVNSDGDFTKARDNAAWLVAKLLKDNNLPLSAVKQHYDFAPNKKNCPETIRNKGLWNSFLSEVNKYYTGTTSSSSSSTSAVSDFRVGDIVQFTGTKHYVFADAPANAGKTCLPGKVKISQVYRVGKSKHPYMVIAVNGGGSTAYGWVDADDLKELAKEEFKAYTAKVTANVLNVRDKASTSGKVVTTINKGEVYTIVEEKNGFGRLKSGAGWISLKYIKVVKYI
jgi:N-acetylmuramoyl-L-alanine amidase